MTRRSWDRRRCPSRRGAVAVVVALCLLPLIGIMAFALDGGLLMARRRQVQAGADAAAHAAACSLYANSAADNGLDPQGRARAAALTFASANGYPNNGTTSSVTVNIPPVAGSFVGRSGYAEVIVTYNQARGFSGIWGSGSLPVRWRTVARGVLAAYSTAAVILLDPSSAGALSVSGSGRIVTNTGIQVNSSNAAAVTATNSGVVTAPSIRIVGNYTTNTGGAINGSIQSSSAAMSNPLTSLAAPNPASLTTQGAIPSYGSYTMNPGVYNGGVTLGGGMTVTMNPGIYYMKSGGFTVANGATLSGSGVMIYIDNGGGQFSFQGGGVINLSAPTSGTYAGVVMFQDPNSTRPISIANGSTTTIKGTVYAAGAQMSIAGGAQNSQYGSQIIARGLNISNNAVISTTGDATQIARRRALGIVE